IALAYRALDLDRPAVPQVVVAELVDLAHRGGQLGQVPPVAESAAAFGVLDLLRMAVDGRSDRGRGAAVVGVPVAEHDALHAPERSGGSQDRVRHRLDA